MKQIIQEYTDNEVMYNDDSKVNRYLVYALNADGKLTHISEVDRGKACECRCPVCNEKLIARKGTIRVNHFAHVSGTECKYGLQSSIHYLAKEIIEENKSLWLPAVSYTHMDESGRLHPNTILFSEGLYYVDEVKLEKKYDEYIPDVILYKNNHVLIVEIYVTHKVDDKKLEKIRKSKISVIEIDLSKVTRQIDKETLRRIINSGQHTYWLYNHLQEEKKTAEENAFVNYKNNLIKKNGNNKRYYKIYTTKYDEDIIYDPPCPSKNYGRYGRVRLVYGCTSCPYFLEIEEPTDFQGDRKLWCQRKHYRTERF